MTEETVNLWTVVGGLIFILVVVYAIHLEKRIKPIHIPIALISLCFFAVANGSKVTVDLKRDGFHFNTAQLIRENAALKTALNMSRMYGTDNVLMPYDDRGLMLNFLSGNPEPNIFDNNFPILPPVTIGNSGVELNKDAPKTQNTSNNTKSKIKTGTVKIPDCEEGPDCKSRIQEDMKSWQN